MTITVQAKSNLFCDVIYTPSNYKVITSVRTEEYPSPMDLLLEAVGSCMVSHIANRAEGNIKLDAQNIVCHLEKIMQEKPVHKLLGVKANVVINKVEELTDEDRILIEDAAKSCPVKNTLKEDIDFQITFTYK